MIEQWKQAGTDLTIVVSRFSELSTLLETLCASENVDIHSLVSHIDSTLGTFQTTIDSKLAQARVSLAKTRNKLTSPRTILSFPQEVLSEIFLNVVYARPHSTTDMEKHLRLIYSELHALLGVCATWRHVGLSCGALWSIVPVSDSISNRPHPRPLSTQLSLHRAGNVKDLYLAISLARDTYYTRLDSVKPHLSRFSIINIHESDSIISLATVLMILLKDGVPPALSKLSLRYSGNNQGRIGQPTGPLNRWFVQIEPQVIQMVKSLSALRLSHIALNWQGVTFSSRLVTLQIGGISLGRQPGINSFMSALASATELRDLRLVAITAVPNKLEDTPAGILVLPKLESLQLEALSFNVLSLFIKATSPKTYHLSINLYGNVANGYVLTEESTIQSQTTANDEVYAWLKDTKISKLVLNPGDLLTWDSPASLHYVLESALSVKTLVLNLIDLSPDMLKALNGSLFSSPLSDQDHDFPELESIEIHGYSLNCQLSELRAGFEELLVNHSINRLVLAGDMRNYKKSEADEVMLEWLKAAIPSFRWLPRELVPPEISHTWELWDV